MVMDELDEGQKAVFAQAPFDHLDAADIIIRSSDGIHFRMIKVLLSLASTIFKDMLALPRSDIESIDETRDGLAIVDLTETSETIKGLLSFCYPAIYTGKVVLETLSEISALLEAATKYEMEGIRKDLIQSLIRPQFLEQQSLRVYAIACRNKLEAEARLAAKYTLRRPILEHPYFPELASIDAEKLYCVQMYRKECAEAAMKVATEHTWIIGDSYAFLNCGCRDDDFVESYTFIQSTPSRKHKYGYQLTVIVHPWWLEYMESARVALQISSQGETVKSLTTVGDAFAAAKKCSACRSTVVLDFRRFLDKFEEEVENRIAKVCII
jgi:hypothetical protein